MGQTTIIPDTEVLPDHDFHSGWGSSYSARGLINSDAQTRALWLQYLSNPASVERQYHVLLGGYTNLFADFFGSYYPFTLHSHATDVLIPTTIASLVLNTVATSPLVLDDENLRPQGGESGEETGTRIHNFCLDMLGWTEEHVLEPNLIAIQGIYGAGYGPLAHQSKDWEIRAIAAGPKPIVVELGPEILQEEVDAKFAAAKELGAIGVLFDVVSTEDGKVLSPAVYQKMKVAAQRNQLLIIADETMTAIRCGAPFSFQRTEYHVGSAAGVQPDLVIFGKGLGVSGMAVGFEGVLTKRLAYSHRAQILQSIMYWRALVSKPVRLPVLIEAIGVLRLAQAEDWPGRSMVIGETVRDILHNLEPSTRNPDALRGLGAMLALDKGIAMRLKIQSAVRRRVSWVRWLPKLDSGMTNRELLMRHVFGKESAEHRARLSHEAEKVGAMPLWCFICGIQATEDAWCRRCFLGLCNNEECIEAFGQEHGCAKSDPQP